MAGRPGVNALLGPNGAGKTTLLRTLLGELRPDSGTVRVGSLVPGAHRRQLLRKVGWMPQDPRLPSAAALHDFVSYAGWLKGMSWGHARQAGLETLELVNLADRAGDRVGSLSGGMQRRAAFAAAIVHRPALLLLDEPMNGLDPEQRVHLREVIRRYGTGACVLLSTHILQDLADLADWVVIVSEGQVSFDGSLSAFVKGTAGEVAQGVSGNGQQAQELEAAYLRALSSRRGSSP